MSAVASSSSVPVPAFASLAGFSPWRVGGQVPVFGWLLVSPAVRRWFVRAGVPAPLRVPVLVLSVGRSQALVSLPVCLARALRVGSPVVRCSPASFVPCRSPVVWSVALASVRRSLGQ